MSRGRVAKAFLVLLAPAALAFCQEPARPMNQDIQRILGELKDRAEQQRKEDRRRALLLVQQAQAAEQAGQVSEAVAHAQKAARLFPESDEIQQYHRYLVQKQKGQRQRAIDEAVAQRRVEEALEQVDQLLRSGQIEPARELAEAARETIAELARTPETDRLRKQVETTLKTLRPAELTAPEDELPAPVRIDNNRTPSPPAPAVPLPLANDSVKRALNQRVSLNWRAQPLPAALRDLSQLSAIPISLDPILDQPGPAPLVQINLRVHQATIERVLRLLGELTGGGYIIADGQVVFTTKANALEFVLSGKYGSAQVSSPGPLFRPVPPLSTVTFPPQPGRVPDYLQSGKAFRDHVREILEPVQP